MPLPKWLQRFSNGMLKTMIASDPSAATASGWSIDNNGDVQQETTPETKQLRDNLAVLGGTASTITAMPIVAPQITGKWLEMPQLLC